MNESNVVAVLHMLKDEEAKERTRVLVADYRRRHPEATAKDHIIALLAEMEFLARDTKEIGF